MTNEKKLNVVDFSTNVSNRIAGIESGSERIAEVLLNEPAETPEEIAELEAITDEEEETEQVNLKTDLLDGPMKNLHVYHINGNLKN